MKFLDANVLLRYLLNDDNEQFEIAKKAIEDGAITSIEVIAEVVYVLSGVYEYSREDTSWFIHNLLLDVEIDNLRTVRYALGIYNQTNLDFIDCVLVAYKKTLSIDVLSFDKKLNKTMSKELPVWQATNEDILMSELNSFNL